MKTVIEMARETGARPQQNKNCDVEYLMSAESLERFAALVRADEREKQEEAFQQILTATRKETCADEREACAKVCDDKHDTWRWDDEADSASGPRDCAAAIRARSQS